MKLTNDQQKALKAANRWWETDDSPTFVIAGAAGTGKTTLINIIIEEIGISNMRVAFAAYTGKAATVMAQKGMRATTIHRLIYWTKFDNGHYIHKLKSRGEIDAELIVIDEISMVPRKMMDQILSFGIPVIGVGDDNQLPPVKGGSQDLLRRPDAYLDEITRQAKESPIIRLSQDIIHGNQISYENEPGLTFVNSMPMGMLARHDQVICGYNKTRARINSMFKTGIPGVPDPGDKLICVQNKWTETIKDDDGNDCDLVNGLTGTVSNVSGMGAMIGFQPMHIETESFENLILDHHTLRNSASPKADKNMHKAFFNYGYCITCHKSQGSEFDSVFLVPEAIGNTPLDRRRWLYTAITRASKQLTIFTEKGR
ncbi:MAG: AAA family ATPase [Halobacteriota archaeon]|nr:AAA family ATPase [Halobacteriota archaeon]